MRVLIDTGPLVALCNERDQYHAWAKGVTQQMPPPFFTCQAVVTEAHHLLLGNTIGLERLHGALESGGFVVSFDYMLYAQRIHRRMRQYASLPMDCADACLVQMAEDVPSEVVTTDADFLIYRIHRNVAIPVRMPAR